MNLRIIPSLWRTRYPKLSAGDLANHLYDEDLGGDCDLLRIEDLVQNDQEALSSQEKRVRELEHRQDRQASISVFDSSFVAALEVFMIVVVTCSMIVTPLTFMYDGRWSNAPTTVPGGITLLSIDIILDVLYGLYIILLLDMSYIHPDTRMEVVTTSKILRYRLKSPMYWTKVFSTTAYIWIILCNVPMWFNLVKVLRIGVFLTMPDSLWRLRDSSGIRLARPVVLLVCCSHWCACLLFCFGGFYEAWEKCQVCSALDDASCLVDCAARTTKFRGHEVSGEISAFMVATVEAMYMLTGALDGPTGDGAREGHFGALIIVVLFAPIGQLFVAWFIASIVQETALSTALETRHSENRAFMLHALQNLNIPKDLQRRVMSMHYFQKMSRDHEALNILFDGKNLNSSLSSALRIYLYKESVLLCPYLVGKDPNYIIEVVQVLKDVVCLPGDYVARRGEIANCMFFVARGRLGVVIPDLEEPANVMKAKKVKELVIPDFFGDIALIKDCVRTCWIRAESYGLLASLSRADVEVVWKYFPEEREKLQQNVAKLAKEDKARAAKKRWKNAFGTKRNELLAMRSMCSMNSHKADDTNGDADDTNGTTGMGRVPSTRQRALDAADGDMADDGVDGGDDDLISGDSAALPNDVARENSLEQLLTQVLQRQVELESKVDMQQKMLAVVLQALGVSAPVDRTAPSPGSPNAANVGESTRQAQRRSVKKLKSSNKKASVFTSAAKSPSSTEIPPAALAGVYSSVAVAARGSRAAPGRSASAMKAPDGAAVSFNGRSRMGSLIEDEDDEEGTHAELKSIARPSQANAL